MVLPFTELLSPHYSDHHQNVVSKCEFFKIETLRKQKNNKNITKQPTFRFIIPDLSGSCQIVATYRGPLVAISIEGRLCSTPI